MKIADIITCTAPHQCQKFLILRENDKNQQKPTEENHVAEFFLYLNDQTKPKYLIQKPVSDRFSVTTINIH